MHYMDTELKNSNGQVLNLEQLRLRLGGCGKSAGRAVMQLCGRKVGKRWICSITALEAFLSYREKVDK
jgi:hypothetical protein